MANLKRSAMARASGLVLAAVLAGTVPNGAAADESNFNQGAYDAASLNGRDNANCWSAIVLTCDAADPAPIGLPTLLGLPAAAGLGVLLLSVASRRRQTG